MTIQQDHDLLIFPDLASSELSSPWVSAIFIVYFSLLTFMNEIEYIFFYKT